MSAYDWHDDADDTCDYLAHDGWDEWADRIAWGVLVLACMCIVGLLSLGGAR